MGKREYSFRDASLREDGRRNPTGQGLEIKAGIGELTSENVVVQADKFIQTADAGQRFILRLGIVAVPVVAIVAAYILIRRKYIIDERKYEELVAEINRGKGVEFNKKVAVFHGTEMFGEPYCHFFVLINFMLKKNPLSYI